MASLRVVGLEIGLFFLRKYQNLAEDNSVGLIKINVAELSFVSFMKDEFARDGSHFVEMSLTQFKNSSLLAIWRGRRV